MAPAMERRPVTPRGRGKPGAARSSRRPLTLADLIIAIQDIVGPADTGLVVATVWHLLRSGRLTGRGTGACWRPSQPEEKGFAKFDRRGQGIPFSGRRSRP